jgi:hypothetical protein
MDEILAAIVTICFLAGVFFSWYFVHSAKVKERLILIEKGVDISNLPQTGNFKFNFPWLKIGMIITGASLGFLSGFVLYIAGIIPERDSEFVVLSLSILFGGIGMILAHYMDKPKEQK